jgi:hypothetical protein
VQGQQPRGVVKLPGVELERESLGSEVGQECRILHV